MCLFELQVDNATYNWMGASPQLDVYVKQTAFEYTSTRSIFTMNVNDKVQMKITFMSPVTPDELLRSSLPYSYMDVEVKSLDGSSHRVQLYTDISAGLSYTLFIFSMTANEEIEWVSGDHSANAQWTYDVIPESSVSAPQYWAPAPSPSWPESSPSTVYGTETAYSLVTSVAHTEKPKHVSQGHRPTKFSHQSQPAQPTPQLQRRAPFANNGTSNSTGGIAYHKVWRQQQLEFSEIDQQANWGYWYYATENLAGLTYQSGADTDVRGQFLANGRLANTQDTNYRAIDDAYPVFGFAVDLGKVSTSSVSTLFQLSLHQENCVQFEGANGNQSVPCLWTSYFDDETSAVSYFYNDYDECSTITSSFDDQISSDSISAGGQDYLSLTSLAVRQAFGALEFTNSPETPWVFLKEISSDGNIQTVDVIFPFHPIAIYTNATLLRYILDPLFINQEAGYWPYQFSIHDLGSAFPNATGHNDGNDEMQPLEECGDMLIMTLAYAQRTNDNAYLAQHYDILKQWNNYLVNDSLIPMNQISTDDFAGSLANQTNLAIKGIIGIEAMAQIANRTGNVEDGQNFTNIAHNYVNKWMGFAIAGPAGNLTKSHTTLAYGENDTYSLLYNLFGDRELGLDLVPQTVYDMQSEFYPTVFNEYGVPLDTRHSYTKGEPQC